MSAVPSHVANDGPRPHLWTADASMADLTRDGEEWNLKENRSVQFIFSRVQHHRHVLNKKGERVPLTACRSKRKPKECKHGYPFTKRLSARVKVVCRGVAKAHGLAVSGRHGALGAILGRRNCAWHTGTHGAFATWLRSNSHIASNDRLPAAGLFQKLPARFGLFQKASCRTPHARH